MARWRRPQQDPDDVGRRVDESFSGSRGTRTSGGGSSSREDDSRSARTPLGVPDDWRTPRPQSDYRGMSANAAERWQQNGATRGPRYFEGDQFKPAQSGRDSIILKQRALLLGGYLYGDFTLGRWDPATVDAYKTLLEEANAAGVTAEEQLTAAAQGIPIGGGGEGSRGGAMIDPATGEIITPQFVPPPLEISTTNRADLERVFEGASQNMLGVALPRDQIRRMAEAYNWVEIQAQKDAYDQEVNRMRQEFEMGVSGGAGMGQPGQQQITKVSAPTPETFILDKLREERPEELEDYAGMTTLMGAMDSWLGG